MKQTIDPFVFQAIRLRLIQEDDLPMTLAWRNRDEVRKWFKYSDMLSIENHREWFQKYLLRDNDFLFVVEDVSTGLPVGQASVYGIDWERGIGEVGRFIAAPDFRGRGYMKQACAAIADVSFNCLGLKEVFLEVFPDNERAIHVYQLVGYITSGATDDGLVRMLKKKQDGQVIL